tara:strand:- start:436 stop:681 length:246 start_codon:yes stop_codon:yes gene_type:complete
VSLDFLVVLEVVVLPVMLMVLMVVILTMSLTITDNKYKLFQKLVLVVYLVIMVEQVVTEDSVGLSLVELVQRMLLQQEHIP